MLLSGGIPDDCDLRKGKAMSRRGGDGMTTHTPEVHARRPHINFWLVAVIALAAGLVALGAWTLVDRYTGSNTEAAQIIDELNTAVNAGDTDGVRQLFARDAVFETPTGERISGLDNVVSVALLPHGVGFQLERAGPVTSEGDFAATFTKYSNGAEGVELSVFQFEDGKIARVWLYSHG
jgi:hypothetical protein